MRTAHVPNASLTPRELLVSLLRPLSLTDAEHQLASFLGGEVVLFASARGALAAAIEALESGDQVAIPAYTCAAVANAVLSAGKRPVYVDVDDRGLVDADAWPSGMLAIVQDTYGFEAAPAPGEFVRDSAHRAYPLRQGEAAVTVTSFEHSKSVSAGRGGLALVRDPELADQLRQLRDRHESPRSRIVQTVVTLATCAMGRLDYAGRHTIAELFRKVAWHLDSSRLLGQSAAELAGAGVDPPLLGRPDGGAAYLIRSQLRRAADVSAHRERITGIYDHAAGVLRPAEPLVRYPLVSTDVAAFETAMLEAGWDVRGRWFTGPLHPDRSDLSALAYTQGTAPTGEHLAATVVNLPTHPLVQPGQAEAMIRTALSTGARPLGERVS